MYNNPGLTSLQSKEVTLLREDQVQIHNLKNQVEKLKVSEHESKASGDKVPELERIIVALKIELEKERENKEVAIEEKLNIKKEKDMVSSQGGDSSVHWWCT